MTVILELRTELAAMKAQYEALAAEQSAQTNFLSARSIDVQTLDENVDSATVEMPAVIRRIMCIGTETSENVSSKVSTADAGVQHSGMVSTISLNRRKRYKGPPKCRFNCADAHFTSECTKVPATVLPKQYWLMELRQRNFYFYEQLRMKETRRILRAVEETSKTSFYARDYDLSFLSEYRSTLDELL